MGIRPASPADGGVQEGPGGEPGGPGQGRPGQFCRARPLPAGRHAADDDRVPPAGIHRHAGDHGKWIDTDGDGRYDLLEVETRGPFKGPRAYDASGLPLHFDNQSLFKERIYRDKADAKILHDEITVIDHALTRPWTVDKKYVLEGTSRLEWDEAYCTENTVYIGIGKDDYFLSGDGLLMPARKDQPPPDLRYFKQTEKK